MRSRDPFGEVREALRHRLRTGALPPGAPVIVLDLAAELGVSATPVREALAHLAGEGLVEGREGPMRGYLAARPGPEALADLLRLHQALVLDALAEARRRSDLGVTALRVCTGGDDRVARTEALFAGLVAQGGGAVLQRAHRQVAARLHLVRCLEPRLLPDLESELADLVAAGPEAGPVRAYHRRRLVQVVRLAGLLGGAS